MPDTTKIVPIMRNDPTLYAKFKSAVESARLNVFSRSMLDGAINTRINLLRDQLISMGKDTTAEINKIRVQLKLARAAAIILSGSGSGSFYLADVNSGEVIHANNSETVGLLRATVIEVRQPAQRETDVGEEQAEACTARRLGKRGRRPFRNELHVPRRFHWRERSRRDTVHRFSV